MSILDRFARRASDSDDAKREKKTILIVAGSCCVAGAAWFVQYRVIFGWGLTALLPLAFVVIVGTSLVVSHYTGNHRIAVNAQILCIIYVTAVIQWSIGGVLDSGFVLIWSLLGPLCAMMFFSVRGAIPWFFLFFVNIGVTAAFDSAFSANGYEVSESLRRFFYMMNITVFSLVVLAFATYYVSSARSEKRRADRLLLNVLPSSVAERLKSTPEVIAESFESASVLFADLVDSTPLFSDLTPADGVDWLNSIFSRFDAAVESYGVEKIRTVGDGYMVAAGVPIPRADHAEAIAGLALDMLAEIKAFPHRNGRRLNFRIGVNSGPLVGGVIGTTKFHYDVWGDTVNVASRMESHGEAGKIQISDATYKLIKQGFVCHPRGRLEVKGKGEMNTWYLDSRRPG